ncbi:MAG: ABC transporter permease [Erysipelotrichaceae bacterium]|jgi:ABC-2 type transport system permease protein|nr:ABC transporter permease [Bacillota bacterium]NLP22577.1 ABC transporter permease [Erysipelotrichaceae bacterium]
MKTWIAFWNIINKDIKNYYLKPPNISWGIIFPLSWTLMQIIKSPDTDIIKLLPGLISMSVLFGTTSMLAVTITFERSGKSFDRLLLAPISLGVLVLSKITGTILFGIFNAFVPVIFASFFINLGLINWGALFFAVIMIAITSSLMGLLVAVSVEQVFEAQTLSNFFRFPMLFLCGLFIPISNLPKFIRPISYFLPLTYGTDILNGAITKMNIISPTLSFIMLFVFTILLFVVCNYQIKKNWIL